MRHGCQRMASNRINVRKACTVGGKTSSEVLLHPLKTQKASQLTLGVVSAKAGQPEQQSGP